MPDSREINHQWYGRFDESRMIILIEVYGPNKEGVEMEIPARFEVCGTCGGKGRHVNPSIDSQGLTAADFAEDPEFEQDYWSGRYDVCCVECEGNRVVPVVDEARATPEQKRRAEEAQDEHYRNQAEDWAARKYGY